MKIHICKSQVKSVYSEIQNLLPIIFILFSICPVAHSAVVLVSETGKEEMRLKEIRKELERSRKKETELSKKEKGILKQLKELEEVLELSMKRTQHLREEERTFQKNVDEMDRKIEESEKDLDRSQKILLKRLRSIYIHGGIHPMELLLSSRTFSEGSVRMKYWRLIAEQDRRIYEEIRVLKLDLENERVKREKSLTELRNIREEEEKEEIQRKIEKKEREGILTQTQKEKKEHTKAIEELQRSARDLEKLMKELEKKRSKKKTITPGTHPFAVMKGKLSWPSKGKVISPFGLKKHPVYKTSTYNNGIDIHAPIGEPVYSIGQGKVVFADRFQGYGKILLIDHGGGYYTLYGHLSDFSVILDDTVEEGEQIGWTGDTGSLEGSKLHFEFRKGGQAVDPLGWLKKR